MDSGLCLPNCLPLPPEAEPVFSVRPYPSGHDYVQVPATPNVPCEATVGQVVPDHTLKDGKTYLWHLFHSSSYFGYLYMFLFAL